MRWILPLLCVVLLTMSTRAQEIKPERGQDLEVCFVLDTTGSMGGLIEGAKQKIWSITNQFIQIKPRPASIRIALIGYRDRGDAYVTQIHDLTDDIDLVFKNLQSFQAQGGGDTPESVNQALDEAVEKIKWSPHRKVVKVIFLVGDCPPHMDYKDDIKYPDVCAKAVKKDLIINTVQCGADGTTTPIWQEIARMSEGSFIQLGQTGDMIAIATPMDADLAELNKKIGTTLVAFSDGRTYGTGSGAFAAAEKEVGAKQLASERASSSVTADRLAYNVRAGKSVGGDSELIDAIESKRVKLSDLKDEQLPEDFRKLSPAEREKRIEELTRQRAELRTKIAELVKKRDAYIEDERKKLASTRPADAFDEQVSKIVNVQAQRKK